jgi:tetratricopeptide (TPR) repeat protein
MSGHGWPWDPLSPGFNRPEHNWGFGRTLLAIDPQNRSAQAEKSSIRPELNGIVEEHLQAARQKIDKSQFAEARKDVQLLEELNRKLERAFDRQVTDLGYTLNYRWAKALFDRKDYASSEAKAAAAIAIRKTDEATALKSKAAQARARAEAGGSFEAGLEQADRLIEQGDWAGAWRKINALSKNMQDRGTLANLENRRERVRAQLPALYEKAVGQYKAEDFEKAIELLETVLKIDVDYEQAAEYMDKAKAKQKLIEQYGGDA